MTEPLLVVATNNAHKVEEIRAILSSEIDAEQLERVVSLKDFTVEEPVEDGVTFAANALIKARHAAKATGLVALADDSGLAVEVLGGSPGVFSARWSGTHGDDVANRQLLLTQILTVPDEHRQASFVAAMALVWPDGTELVVEGTVHGTLRHEDAGEGGFGYDPIFVPEGHTMTTAEMSAEEKNRVSHRAAALKKLVEPLRGVLTPPQKDR